SSALELGDLLGPPREGCVVKAVPVVGDEAAAHLHDDALRGRQHRAHRPSPLFRPLRCESILPPTRQPVLTLARTAREMRPLRTPALYTLHRLGPRWQTPAARRRLRRAPGSG